MARQQQAVLAAKRRGNRAVEQPEVGAMAAGAARINCIGNNRENEKNCFSPDGKNAAIKPPDIEDWVVMPGLASTVETG